MNNQTQTAHINALLADAAYVRLRAKTDETGGTPTDPILTGTALVNRLSTRMTRPQAQYIVDNFKVIDQTLSPTGGFDAVIWKGKAGKDFEGKTFVSMRGTQEFADLPDDGTLATSGMPYDQVVEMVNWWMKLSTPKGNNAKQIRRNPFNPFELVEDFPVEGTGQLNDHAMTQIEGVNGHGMGEYLAANAEFLRSVA